jgi:hypothetical protein
MLRAVEQSADLTRTLARAHESGSPLSLPIAPAQRTGSEHCGTPQIDTNHRYTEWLDWGGGWVGWVRKRRSLKSTEVIFAQHTGSERIAALVGHRCTEWLERIAALVCHRCTEWLDWGGGWVGWVHSLL